MAKVIVNGATVEASSVSYEQIEAAVDVIIADDNHAAQNVATTRSVRDWFEQYCDLHVTFYGRLVAI